MTNPLDNHDIEIISVAAIFQTLMTAAFIIRLISVRLRHRKFAVDDVLLAIAFVRLPLDSSFVLIIAMVLMSFRLQQVLKSSSLPSV